MRSQLRMSLSSSGFAKLHLVGNIKDALERMASNKYDVILCDYSLGDSTDGQQFLEYLRTNELISRNTIFIMITAEQAYEKVWQLRNVHRMTICLSRSAAQFNARLERLLEKQAYFSALDKAADSKNWMRVIAECNKKLPDKDKYFVELCKIKAAALMHDGRPKEAAEVYREILAMRPVGWARLGLAKALAALDKKEEAKDMVQQILVDTPQFMAAYDLKSKLLASTGDKHGALEVLQQAREISPHVEHPRVERSGGQYRKE
jgi:CheY-like chemotaxis protein